VQPTFPKKKGTIHDRGKSLDDDQSHQGKSRGASEERACYNCGEVGDLFADCKKPKRAASGRAGKTLPGSEAGASSSTSSQGRSMGRRFATFTNFGKFLRKYVVEEFSANLHMSIPNR
jgi:hypothetical protein